MPPSAVKTVRDLIFWQYAAIMTDAAKGRKNEWALRMSFLTKLKSGELSWSNSVREWVLEMENPKVCIYCGSAENLTTDHIVPRSKGGEDVPDNVVRVCKSCNSSKGAKGLYEWKGLENKNNHHRIAEGKYLKYIYSLHEKNGTLDMKLDDMCPCPLKQKCIDEEHEHKLTLYCIEGNFACKQKAMV